jgi:hypothetical protein
MAHVNVLQVLLLTLCSDVFERRWAYVVPTVVMPAITSSIHWEWLKTMMYMSVSEQETRRSQ